jgi:GNAT superfamily N-acetyltransferase
VIRLAKVSEIPHILRITRRCAAELCNRGIFQWSVEYPSEKAFRRDLELGALWVLEFKGTLVGTLSLTDHMDREYEEVTWLTPNRNNSYVHRLSVDPDFQGEGLGGLLMDFAENHARQNGVRSIRLDTFSRNTQNQLFYERRGYQRLGAVYFPSQSPYPFYCYELILSSRA